jgi:hypothetical protein
MCLGMNGAIDNNECLRLCVSELERKIQCVYVFGQSDVYERIECDEFGRLLFSRRSTTVPRHNWSSTQVRRRRHDDFKVAIEL